MDLMRWVSLILGISLLAGCATARSPSALESWKARRDALLREAAAYQLDSRLYNTEVEPFNRAWKQVQDHGDWPAVEACLNRWGRRYDEAPNEVAKFMAQCFTDADPALVTKVVDLAPQGRELMARKTNLDARKDSLQVEYYRLESDLMLLVAEQREAAARQERLSQNLQALGLSMLLMGQAAQQSAVPISPPLPPINCTTQYIGRSAYTNCR